MTREVEIERARLKHDAEQRSAAPAARPTSWPKMRDAPGRIPNRCVISENSVLLPAPFSPSKHGETRRRDGEVDVDQGAAGAIGVLTPLIDSAVAQPHPAGPERPASVAAIAGASAAVMARS